jgi:pyruvate ferredoxin oxidoreductase gamma subunit
LREPITHPDALVVQDPTLLHQVDLFAGLGPDGYLVLNTSTTLESLGLAELTGRLAPDHVVTVPATEIAREHVGRPVPNVPLLGAFAALTGQVSLQAVLDAVRERFPGELGEGNARAAEAAHEHVRRSLRRFADAASG